MELPPERWQAREFGLIVEHRTNELHLADVAGGRL